MNNRNKILIQLLNVSVEYDLEIIKINFRNITRIMDEIEIGFKIGCEKFLIKFSYEKDNMYDVNNVGRYIKHKLDEFLMEE